MPKTEGFFLADISNIDHVGDGADGGEHLFLALRFENMFQFEADIEVIFDGRLATPSDDNHVLNAGVQRLFNTVLDDRFIDQRQHFFGTGFRGGKETSAQPGGRKDSLSDFGDHYFLFYLTKMRKNN